MEGQKLGNRSRLGERQYLAHSVTHSVTHRVTHSIFFYRECRSSKLLILVSETAVTSQDGSSLEFVAATAARECNIQNARGGGLWAAALLCKVVELAGGGVNVSTFQRKSTQISSVL